MWRLPALQEVQGRKLAATVFETLYRSFGLERISFRDRMFVDGTFSSPSRDRRNPLVGTRSPCFRGDSQQLPDTLDFRCDVGWVGNWPGQIRELLLTFVC